MRFCSVVALAAALLAGACSSRGRVEALEPLCDEAIGQAATAGLVASRTSARAALGHSIGQSKSYLYAQGYGHVSAGPPSVACQPYKIGPIATGLTRCVATARVCGR
ncbi:MAG: hypothetical protein K2Y05_08450 [Hyphomicrobiaceae bacterium]|nr:hypothetical protein [Hyphomicrobiaceae bacterium]